MATSHVTMNCQSIFIALKYISQKLCGMDKKEVITHPS